MDVSEVEKQVQREKRGSWSQTLKTWTLESNGGKGA